jgi:hypothetical protein
LPQLADGQPFQRRDFVDNVHVHGMLLSQCSANGQPVWTVSLKSPSSSRP